jgi:hypothetical protein
MGWQPTSFCVASHSNREGDAPLMIEMSLNESIVEDAALEWFEELGYAVEHGPQVAPSKVAEKKEVGI